MHHRCLRRADGIAGSLKEDVQSTGGRYAVQDQDSVRRDPGDRGLDVPSPSPDPVTLAKAVELASIHAAAGTWLSQQRDGLLAVRQATMEKAQLKREIHTEASRELLLAHGMDPDILTAMSGMVDLFEAAQKRWTKGRDDHVAATTKLRELARAGRTLLRHLDALERRRLRGQPELIATWDAARNVPYRARPSEEAQANQPAA
jgi:hypothetical protein